MQRWSLSCSQRQPTFDDNFQAGDVARLAERCPEPVSAMTQRPSGIWRQSGPNRSALDDEWGRAFEKAPPRTVRSSRPRNPWPAAKSRTGKRKHKNHEGAIKRARHAANFMAPLPWQHRKAHARAPKAPKSGSLVRAQLVGVPQVDILAHRSMELPAKNQSKFPAEEKPAMT